MEENVKEISLLKRFVSYYKKYKLLFAFDMFICLLMSSLAVIYPIVTRLIFNDFVPNENVVGIIVSSCILLAIYVLRAVLRFLVDYYGHGLGVKMQADMRRDLFNKLEDLSFSYYDEHETGAIMSRMTNDLQNVSELAHHGPENIFISSITVISALIYLFTINWLLTLIIASCMPILFFISLFTRRKHLQIFGETRKDIASINANIENAVTGIRVTKAFTNKEKEVAKFEVGNMKYASSRTRAYKYMGIYHASTNFVIDIFNVACICGGALIALYTKAFDVGDYLAFAVSISLFTSPLMVMINFVEQYQDGITGFKRFIDIIDIKGEEDYLGAEEHITLDGNIEFRNVSFAYETSEGILKNVSFKIKKGEKIALVGESGGGKTTICHLIPRFYNLSSGDIYFDDINIKDITLNCLRKNIGIVQQDVFLFNGTIKDNILYGRLNATDLEVIEASKKANIYDYIVSLPNGFDTHIGERGVKLSGGQKQRIAIARIFLKDPNILILDEATSALDNTTEILVQESLNALVENRTSIVVAHRLSTIRDADRIFLINNGEIKEEGSHEELIKLNGEYKKLYEQQFKLNR